MGLALRRVGRYVIVRQIGRGGMSVVYLARQETLERDVALKELSAFEAGESATAQRFLRESRLAGSLNHPNVATVHEYFEEGGVPYIAMEYLPRGSLRPYVGRLSLAQFAGVMEGVLAGLAHAEGFGIVHRDMKPRTCWLRVTGG
jgi:serine/threonine protein kinase